MTVAAGVQANASREPFEPEVERLVERRERDPRPAPAGLAEALARRERDALLGEDLVGA